MASSVQLTQDYWEGQERRSQKYIRRQTPVFDTANSKINKELLEALNDRIYLKNPDPHERMMAAFQDPVFERVNNIIKATGAKSLQVTLKAQPEVYREEAPLQAAIYTERNIFGLEYPTPKLSKKDVVEIETLPYRGKTYKMWATDYTNSAMKTWEDQFMATMVSRTQEVGKVSKDVILLSAARKLMNTMELRAKTTTDGACANTARYINAELIEYTLKLEAKMIKQVNRTLESI